MVEDGRVELFEVFQVLRKNGFQYFSIKDLVVVKSKGT